jgi:ribosome biogenesis GTPase A
MMSTLRFLGVNKNAPYRNTIRFSSNFVSSRFEDVQVKVTEEESLSKRKRFKQIPLNYAVLNHLDTLELGFVPKSRSRRMNQAKSVNIENSVKVKGPTAATPPFDKVGQLFKSATTWEELPRNRAKAYEIAICGRSNVGKSTLLNTLLNLRKRPQLRAPVSDKPGETTKLDFFSVGRSSSLTICDMPGDHQDCC